MSVRRQHHEVCHLRPGILILSRDKFAVDDDMVGENIPERRGFFVESTSCSQFALWMLWCHGDAQLLDLKITHGSQVAPCHNKFAIRIARLKQAKRTMTYTPDNFTFLPGFGHFLAKNH